MDSAHKYAYRYLIYQGTLSIRPVAYVGSAWWERWNLLYWFRERRRIRSAGRLANWLHNLALFSAIDFVGFDEDTFWSELEELKIAFPADSFGRFRDYFKFAVSEFNEGRKPALEVRKSEPWATIISNWRRSDLPIRPGATLEYSEPVYRVTASDAPVHMEAASFREFMTRYAADPRSVL